MFSPCLCEFPLRSSGFLLWSKDTRLIRDALHCCVGFWASGRDTQMAVDYAGSKGTRQFIFNAKTWNTDGQCSNGGWLIHRMNLETFSYKTRPQIIMSQQSRAPSKITHVWQMQKRNLKKYSSVLLKWFIYIYIDDLLISERFMIVEGSDGLVVLVLVWQGLWPSGQ